MALSVLDDPSRKPDDADLARVLKNSKPLWDDLIRHIDAEYKPVTHDWRFAGKAYGWSLRLIRKKRTILYLIPEERHFLTAFVFGEKATTAILTDDFPEAVVTQLKQARAYAEGRGIRLETRAAEDVAIMKKLAAVKMAS